MMMIMNDSDDEYRVLCFQGHTGIPGSPWMEAVNGAHLATHTNASICVRILF